MISWSGQLVWKKKKEQELSSKTICILPGRLDFSINHWCDIALWRVLALLSMMIPAVESKCPIVSLNKVYRLRWRICKQAFLDVGYTHVLESDLVTTRSMGPCIDDVHLPEQYAASKSVSRAGKAGGAFADVAEHLCQP